MRKFLILSLLLNMSFAFASSTYEEALLEVRNKVPAMAALINTHKESIIEQMDFEIIATCGKHIAVAKYYFEDSNMGVYDEGKLSNAVIVDSKTVYNIIVDENMSKPGFIKLIDGADPKIEGTIYQGDLIEFKEMDSWKICSVEQ